MISLRYHLLSLVAVFFALAIGILIGSAFVMRADIRSISQNLQKEFAKVREEVRKEREATKQIQAINENYRKFAQILLPSLVKGKLMGQSVGIICIGKVEDKTASELRNSIEMAGGRVSFVIYLTPSQIQGREEENDELFTIFANNISVGNKDGLKALERENLINIKDWQGTASKLLVISDKQADKERVKGIDVPLINQLMTSGLKVIGGEEFTTSFSAIPSYRDLGISTVDCVDYEIGEVGVVLLLSGKEGNYGMGKGADALLPPL
jgi:hypothetical protein